MPVSLWWLLIVFLHIFKFKTFETKGEQLSHFLWYKLCFKLDGLCSYGQKYRAEMDDEEVGPVDRSCRLIQQK